MGEAGGVGEVALGGGQGGVAEVVADLFDAGAHAHGVHGVEAAELVRVDRVAQRGEFGGGASGGRGGAVSGSHAAQPGE